MMPNRANVSVEHKMPIPNSPIAGRTSPRPEAIKPINVNARMPRYIPPTKVSAQTPRVRVKKPHPSDSVLAA